MTTADIIIMFVSVGFFLVIFIYFSLRGAYRAGDAQGRAEGWQLGYQGGRDDGIEAGGAMSPVERMRYVRDVQALADVMQATTRPRQRRLVLKRRRTLRGFDR